MAGAAAGGAGSKQAAGASGLVAGRRKSFEAEDFYSALEADRAAEVEKGMGAEEQASVAAKGALAAVAKPAGAAEPAARGGRRMSFEAEDAQMAAFSAASAAACKYTCVGRALCRKGCPLLSEMELATSSTDALGMATYLLLREDVPVLHKSWELSPYRHKRILHIL